MKLPCPSTQFLHFPQRTPQLVGTCIANFTFPPHHTHSTEGAFSLSCSVSHPVWQWPPLYHSPTHSLPVTFRTSFSSVVRIVAGSFIHCGVSYHFPGGQQYCSSPAVLAAVKSKTLPIKVQNKNQNRIFERVSNSPTAIHRATINRFSLFAANQTPLLHINLISWATHHPQNEVVYDWIGVLISLSWIYLERPSSEQALVHSINNRLTTKSALRVNFNNKTLFFLSFHTK